MSGTEDFEILNGYTLSVTNDFDRQAQADPELRRIFNFKARQVTNIFSQWYSEGVSNSMVIQKFSELDSLAEVFDMHAKLKELGGNPPDISDLSSDSGKPAVRNRGLSA